MTAQINDSIRYRGKNWNLIASTSEFRFDPAEYGLKPLGRCSACWDGYYEEFSIAWRRLKLRRLWVTLESYPSLLGVEPKEKWDGFLFDHVYDLNIKIDYTGKMLLGKDFLYECYEHMGYQQAWSYLTVFEFEFKDGILINVFDLSECVAELRGDLKKVPDMLKDIHRDVSSYVDNSFARDYENKAWWISRYEHLKKDISI